jgi:hypothetical protein
MQSSSSSSSSNSSRSSYPAPNTKVAKDRCPDAELHLHCFKMLLRSTSTANLFPRLLDIRDTNDTLACFMVFSDLVIVELYPT